MWFKKKSYIKFYLENNQVKFELYYGKGEALEFLNLVYSIFHIKDVEKNVLNSLGDQITQTYNTALSHVGRTDRPVMEPFNSFQGRSVKLPN